MTIKIKLTFNIFKHLSCLSHSLSSIYVAYIYSHASLRGEGERWQLHKEKEETQFSIWKSRHRCRLQRLFRLWRGCYEFSYPTSKLVSKLAIKK
jgi:hypothetical protein